MAEDETPPSQQPTTPRTATPQQSVRRKPVPARTNVESDQLRQPGNRASSQSFLMPPSSNGPPPETRPRASTTTGTSSTSYTGDTLSRPSEEGYLSVPPPPYRAAAPPTYLDIDRSLPPDFDGEVQTTDEIPSILQVKSIEDYIVLDQDGKSRTFKSLYSSPNVARRVLIIFVRHFFCGNCQDYIRTLSETVTPTTLLQLPVSTFIAIIGCGDPGLIRMYAKETNCPFPIYTDPKRTLFDALGMRLTLNMGAKPAYMKRPLSTAVFNSIGQAIRALPSGMTLKSGNQKQVGGEFLFEPEELLTPIGTPTEEQPNPFDAKGLRERAWYHPDDVPEQIRVEEKRITWCHRMRTTRDHCEIPELMEVLGLEIPSYMAEAHGWTEFQEQDKRGKGTSMAQRMGELRQAAELPPPEL